MSFDLGKLTSLFKFDLSGAHGGQIIGVDIGSSSIKVVQLHLEKEVPMLDTYGELQLGPYAELDIGKIVSLEQKKQTEALVDIIRESVITANSAALSVSYSASFATTLTVDAIEDKEIAALVPAEARKYIPVSLNEVTLDWFPLSQDVVAKRTELFLVAIHNSSFAQLRGVLSGAGLSLAYTELEPFSAARSVLSEQNKTAVLVDLGASATRMYIAKDGIIQKTHSIPFGGTNLTEALATTLSVPFAEAEQRKRDTNIGSENDEVVKTIRKSLERVFRELDKVIDGYEQTTGSTFSSVYLLGGGAELRGLPTFVEDLLQRRITLGAPFSKVAYPAFLEDTLKAAGPSFGVAVGVALRNFG